MATQTVQNPAKDAAAKAREAEAERIEKEADATNATRTGKGTRLRVGQTRGRNPQVITWEAFDQSKPETLPSDLANFMEVTGIQDEARIVSFLIDGFNAEQYTQASDPIAEFVNAAWPDEIQKNFRLAVKNYAQATNVSLEDAVSLIKPAVEKKVAADAAAAAAKSA